MNNIQRKRLKIAKMANALPIKENQPNQKFPRGSKVMVAEIMPPYMFHFECGFEAIVEYTYAQKFWGDDINSYSLIQLDDKGEPINSIAWYEENQLTLIDDNVNRGIQIINNYKQ